MHTCHDNCKRPMCVLRRERDELLDRLTSLELRMPEELARLERERDEARKSLAMLRYKTANYEAHIRNAERERDEALAAIVGWEIKWKCAVEMAAQAEVERDKALEDLENHKAESMHTCHDNCKRPMCVLRRERDAERALADRLAEAAMKSSNLIGPPDKVTWSTENEINDAWNCAQSSLSAWKEARNDN